MLEAANLRYVVGKLSDKISRWIVVAHDKHLTLAVLAHADAEIFALLPHHLREVSRSGGFRLDSKRVLLNFIVPSINGIFSVNFMVGIGAVRCVIENA